MKSILVAYDKRRGIGADNDLLWSRDMPADLRRFKELTTGNAIIMGWGTYKSIGRSLPNRQNIVMSRSSHDAVAGVTVVKSLEAAYAAVEPGKEVFVVGGGQIYAHAINTVDRIYATEVDATFGQADVFFPEIDTGVWHEISREHHDIDERNLYGYDFVVYERVFR
nr:Dihydrofolate reductase [uncultured bacterium]